MRTGLWFCARARQFLFAQLRFCRQEVSGQKLSRDLSGSALGSLARLGVSLVAASPCLMIRIPMSSNGEGHLPARVLSCLLLVDSVGLPAVFRAAHLSLLWRLKLGPVKPCGLTMRAPDKWDSARLTSFFLASGLYCSQAFSRPAHLQVTLPVGLQKDKQCVLGLSS